jgi:hypothetical protein
LHRRERRIIVAGDQRGAGHPTRDQRVGRLLAAPIEIQ